MKVNDEVVEKYPFFADFVKLNIPAVRHKDRVMKAFVKWSGLSRSRAMKLTRDVTVHVANFRCRINPATGKPRTALAKTFDTEEIGINKRVVVPYEAAAVEAYSDWDKRPTLIKWATFIEATLMHELVHVARKIRRVELSAYADEEKFPLAFEREAYGRVMQSPTELRCAQ